MLSLGWEGIQVGWHPRVGEPVLAPPRSPQCRPADTALTVAVHMQRCESASLGVHGQGLSDTFWLGFLMLGPQEDTDFADAFHAAEK